MNRILILILIMASFLRLYGINWDQGFHLHPDERQLILVADHIRFFSNLNPDFFNYGTLPIYMLKGAAQLLDLILNTHFATYTGLLYLGRGMSIAADLVTIYLIYRICTLLFSKKDGHRIGLFGAFLYSIAFFPIQNSHFFVVDVFLTLFITLCLYCLIEYVKNRRLQWLIFLGIACAAAAATKITALLLIIYVILTLIALIFFSKKKTFIPLVLFVCTSAVFHFLFMPFAYLSYVKFFEDVTLQGKMAQDPYIFPYTLQYVRTLPYLYFLKNIFLWGFGPIISLLSIFGGFVIFRKIRENKEKQVLIVFSTFYLLYFLIIGFSAVKFMRYMLPVYPFLAIFAGFGVNQLHKINRFLIWIIIILISLWTFMFVNIYSQTHTRIAATEWILKNIAPRSTLAIEHWDDSLPLLGQENYQFVTLTQYDQPDSAIKWNVINENLHKADYLIIASNRLYIPLPKLEDCKKYKLCYPMTTDYYNKLFSGKLGFKQVAEFAVYPNITFGPLHFAINDQSADESFTVYDHPKILIFKKQ